jgi:hypothetical protein
MDRGPRRFGPATRSQEDEAMSSVSGAAGHAALAICESMLVSLTENKILDGAEAKAILADAAAAHRHSIPLVVDGGAAAHEEAASLIEAILKGGNSVRHP